MNKKIIIEIKPRKPILPNVIAQGNTTYLKMIDFKVGILLNPHTNMKIEFGVLNRKTTSTYEFDTNTNHVYIAFKTDLRNLYYDF